MDFPVHVTCILQGFSVIQGNPITFTAKTFAVCTLYFELCFTSFFVDDESGFFYDQENISYIYTHGNQSGKFQFRLD